ncbi:MAG: hypothetical protein ABI222_10920 [Opitutaceae bacterium]
MTPATQAALPFLNAAGWFLLLFVLIWSLRGVWRNYAAATPGWQWWVLTGAMVLCFRWPLLGVPHEMNPDESQLIAGALTLRHDPVFWRSVDGGTAGPLDFYPLLPAAWADGMGSYAIARLIGLAMAFGAIVLAGETVALLTGATLARIAVLPALAATAFTTSPDFIHYSTELMPVLLLAAAGYALVRQSLEPAPRWLWLSALLLGCAVWAKLQVAPIAAGLWLLAAGCELRAGRKQALVALFAGALLPTLVCLVVATLTGQAENLIITYGLNNFGYVSASHLSWPVILAVQWRNVLAEGYFGCWLAGAGICLVPVGLWFARNAPKVARCRVLATVLLLVIGALCAIVPSRPSAHHLELIPLPLIWVTGTVLALAWLPMSAAASARRRLGLGGLFLVCSLGPQLAWRVAGVDAYAAINAAGLKPAHRELTTLVRTYSASDEPLAIWGWRCSLYVEAGRRQATRQAQTEPQMTTGRFRPYYLRRYFEDFKASNPPVFADAVGPGAFAYDDRIGAHESFPPLRAWVESRYTQLTDLDGTRLYVRNDRLTGPKKSE